LSSRQAGDRVAIAVAVPALLRLAEQMETR
jgi:hypothetical protein